MIAVDRGREKQPPVLAQRRPSDNTTELERARSHRKRRGQKKPFEYQAYKDPAVKAALDRLFHGKCAYCESFYAKTQPVDVEHYRPKGEVEGMKHPGYWWLAMVWNNLLPSCIDCNRKREQVTPDPSSSSMVSLHERGEFNRSRKLSTGKASAFPLEPGSPRASRESHRIETERCLLLDPTRDEPADHLLFHIDRSNLIGLVYPRPVAPGAVPTLPLVSRNPAAIGQAAMAAGASLKGAISIQVYGLNRLSLVQARTKLLRDLEFLLELTLGLTELIVETNSRIEVKNRQAAAALPNDARAIRDDVAFLERVKKRLERFRADALSQMRDTTQPTAPFSAMAKAWMRAYLATS